MFESEPIVWYNLFNQNSVNRDNPNMSSVQTGENIAVMYADVMYLYRG